MPEPSAINDRYGHNAGDYVLVNTARIMREVCAESTVSRWGGEEFVCLLDAHDCQVHQHNKHLYYGHYAPNSGRRAER